jgi:hypothetical protein
LSQKRGSLLKKAELDPNVGQYSPFLAQRWLRLESGGLTPTPPTWLAGDFFNRLEGF